MKFLKESFIIIFLFMFIYFPPIFSINLMHILTLFSLIALVLIYRKTVVEIFNNSIKMYMIPVALVLVYVSIIVLTKNGDRNYIYKHILIFMEVSICITYICSYFNRRKYDIDKIFDVLMVVGSIQALISILCILVPPVKQLVVNIYMAQMIEQNVTDVMAKGFLLELTNHRINGISTSLLFAMPIVQAVLATIALYLGINKNSRYAILSPILLFSSIVNARVGIVVFLCGVIIVIITSKKKVKENFKLIGIISAITVAILILIFIIILNSKNSTMQWIMLFIEDTCNLFKGKKTGTFEFLFGSFIRFPELKNIFFGTGRDIFLLDTGMRSDIGYINDIWFGGIMYIVISYGAFINYYFKAFNRKYNFNIFISIMLITTFVVTNIKGSIVGNNEFINLSMLLSTILILKNKGYYLDEKDII